MKPTITEEQLEEELHARLMTGLENLKQNLELYLTNDLLPVFYAKYVARCKENKTEYIFTFEQYIENAREYITRYHELSFETDMQTHTRTLPPWEFVKKRKKKRSAYYAIYQDIINLAEKWPPPLEITERWAIMVEKIGVKPRVVSIMEWK